MDIKIYTNVSEKFNEIEIVVNAPKITEDFKKIIENLADISNSKNEIIGKQNNEIFLLKLKDILFFYSDEKYNYCKTQDGTYKVQQRLYELEEKLPKDKFIRISNSNIVNIEEVECFDVSNVGSIIVKMKDKNKLPVSKRRIKYIMKFLNERR